MWERRRVESDRLTDLRSVSCGVVQRDIGTTNIHPSVSVGPSDVYFDGDFSEGLTRLGGS